VRNYHYRALEAQQPIDERLRQAVALPEITWLRIALLERGTGDVLVLLGLAETHLRQEDQPLAPEGRALGPRDFTRRYLRAIGKAPALTREREVELGQQIEMSQRAVVDAVLATPLAARVGLSADTPDPRQVTQALTILDVAMHALADAGDNEAAHKRVEAKYGMSAKAITDTATRVRDRERHAAHAKAELVESHLRLVVHFAKRYRNLGLPFDDLVQEGNIGLMTAANRYDYRRGTRFSTYASWWIREAMRRAISTNGRAIRLPANRTTALSALTRARKRLIQELRREPTQDELAHALGTTPKRVDELMLWGRRVVSLEQPLGPESEGSLTDIVANPNAELPSALLMASELTTRAREQLATLSSRERQVLSMRFGLEGEEMTLEAIGAKLGVTRERVRQIETKALDRLRHPSRARLLAPLIEGDNTRS
jgi:RNA polymerase sigma factor (sigma-70 family)